MKKLLFTLLLTGSIFLINSCEEKKEKEQAIESMEEKDSSDSSAVNADTATATASKAQTQITFEESEFDFGKIKQGTMVEHVFKFKNTGTAPLIIQDARASCGCTVPEWPKEAIAPGGEGKIAVKYNGSGSGQVEKNVTVTANTEPQATVLKIKANVEETLPPVKGPLKK